MEILWEIKKFEAMEMRRKFRVIINGKEYTVEIEELGENIPQTAPAQTPSVPQYTSAPPQETGMVAPTPTPTPSVGGEGTVTAPMPGKILDVKVKPGDSVKEGDVLIILEAMKMENEVVAPSKGVVKEVRVSPGDSVNRGDVLVVIG